MALPGLTVEGLLPTGRHVATVDDVRVSFVDAFPASVRRPRIYAGWLQYLRLLRDAVPPGTVLWIDGSFVSSKQEPGDIDQTAIFDGLFWDAMPPQQKQLATMLLDASFTRPRWAVHAFGVPIYPEGHPSHELSVQAYGYWEWWWGHTRDGSPKGFLEVP